jgi:CsoR family transcriptional regulator, copper-sensing transcriptional repressor
MNRRKYTGGVYGPGMNEPGLHAPARRYGAEKEQLLTRLRRIEGQTRGIQAMVADDRWCPDILQQVAAARAALERVALGLAEGHVRHCMAEGAEDPKRLEEMTDELMQAMGRVVR